LGSARHASHRDRNLMIRVLVVDDQKLVRAGFRMILEAEADLVVVGEAGDGADAIEQAKRCQADVVLMDIRMPGTDGIAATAVVTAMANAPRVLVLTTFDLDEYVHEALRAGASGFLLKDTPPEQLVEAIRVVHAGDAVVAPSVTRRLIESFARSASPTPPAALEQLTEREVDVLRAMARGQSNAEIAAELILGEATVKTHVGRVLMKLGLRDRVQAVVFAYEHGIVQPGTSS
jgi:DNA-binding NarL/FixJ family response regulator